MRKMTWLLLIAVLSGCDSAIEGVALGNLERERVAHTAPVQEVIVALPVRQGAVVEEGDILVEFDKRAQTAVVAGAMADVARAQAQLDKMRSGARVEEVAGAQAEVAAARASVLETQQNYARARDLVARQMQSQAALDHATAQRDEAEARLQSSQERLRQLTNGTREEDLRIAEAELGAARARLEGAQKQLDDLTVRATRAGLLDNLPWNLGERVAQGSPVAVVLASDAPFARVYVPESYRVLIRAGVKLGIRVDGVPDEISGVVRWISSEPSFTPYFALTQTERSRLMYLAEVQLPIEYADLPAGLPVEVVMPSTGDLSD